MCPRRPLTLEKNKCCAKFSLGFSGHRALSGP